MAGSANKTTATLVIAADFLAAVPDPRRREEAAVIDALHRRVTGCEPVMWGPSIVGYGNYCDRRAEADDLFARLGKHTTGKSCLYIRKLAEVDLEVLEKLVALSWACMNDRYPD